MAQWGNTDIANNSVLWGVAGYNKAPNTANRDAFYGNTTADAYITGLTVGQYGVDTEEATGTAGVAHPGWVVKKEGSGGRAGRVSFETLVAMSTISGDSDPLSPVPVISISIQPQNATANATNNDIDTFSVTAGATGNTVLSYRWQKWDGSAFANLTNTGAYSNTTTATMTVLANTASNGEIYRVGVYGTNGAQTVFSSNAVITITT